MITCPDLARHLARPCARCFGFMPLPGALRQYFHQRPDFPWFAPPQSPGRTRHRTTRATRAPIFLCSFLLEMRSVPCTNAARRPGASAAAALPEAAGNAPGPRFGSPPIFIRMAGNSIYLSWAIPRALGVTSLPMAAEFKPGRANCRPALPQYAHVYFTLDL